MASQIADMGEKVMLVLYVNKDYQTLDDLRKFHYNLKVATSKNVVQAKALPQLPMQQCNTPTGYIIRYKFGWGMKKTRYSEDGI